MESLSSTVSQTMSDGLVVRRKSWKLAGYVDDEVWRGRWSLVRLPCSHGLTTDRMFPYIAWRRSDCSVCLTIFAFLWEALLVWGLVSLS